MEEGSEDPLVKALPPASDYLTYLTIVEYNLTKQRLPLFHRLLQDTTLTTNIGWDLVHLLLPLLPASETCLEDVARLGNPREVILKVTEMLEEVAHENRADVERYDNDSQDENSIHGIDTALNDVTLNNNKGESGHLLDEASRRKAVFSQLLKMLEILHPRIKTKYPSRFLSTSLKATIRVYAVLAPDKDVTIRTIKFIRQMSNITRPPLPARSGNDNTQQEETPPAAPDPEDEHEALTVTESKAQKRLLQVFVIQVFEFYSHAASVDYENTGLVWSTRFQETMHPEKTMPGRVTYNHRCGRDENTFERQDLWLKLYHIAFDMGLRRQDLTETIMKAALPKAPSPLEEVDSDDSPEETSLPISGSFLLLCCSIAVWHFHGLRAPHTNVALFPDFAALVVYFIGRESLSYVGAEPPMIIDAIIFLGLTIFASDRTAAPFQNVDVQEKSVQSPHAYAAAPPLEYPQDYEPFHALLQRLSLLSAQCPFPSLRYNAHLLTSQILHTHPDDAARLRFITDTLEHCPYENLQASAIGWLKEEILRAQRLQSPDAAKDPANQGIFLHKNLLKRPAISSAIFPPLPPGWSSEGTPSRTQLIVPLSSILLASLNFWIFLLASPLLRERYGIVTIAQEAGFESGYLTPIIEMMTEALDVGDEKRRDSGGNDVDDDKDADEEDDNDDGDDKGGDVEQEDRNAVDEMNMASLIGTVAQMVREKLREVRGSSS